MKAHDLYGYSKNNIEAIREAIERTFGIKMEHHESSFHGDYYVYRFGASDGEQLMLKFNLDPIDKKPVESKFPEAFVLLYVNNTERAKKIEAILGQNVPELKILNRGFA